MQLHNISQQAIILICTLSLLWGVAEASSKVKEVTEGKREFLHFGNMGGLMPDLELADLPDSSGAEANMLFNYCSQCHNAPGPGMRTAKQWATIYWDMYWRMHMMNAQFDNFMVLNYNDSKLLFQYLQKHALKSIRSNQVKPHLDGMQEYQRTCMQCHDLPDPEAYPNGQWDSLVVRMRRHMESMGKVVPDHEQITRIILYLKHASE